MNAVAFERIEQRFKHIAIVPYEPQYLASALKVAHEIHQHSLYRDFPLDEKKLIAQLSSSGVTVPDRYFKLAVRGEEVLGGLYGCLLRVFFCDEWLAKDMGWWVRENSRGGAAAMLLLADFERWARAKGARKLMIGQSGVENLRRTAALFQHCGFTFTGVNAAKDLSHG